MKRLIGIVLIVIIICLAGWMIYASFKTVSNKKKIAKSIAEVPVFNLQKTDSSIIKINQNYSKSPLLLIYFNSECDFCREEAISIAKNHKLLDGMLMVFISIEPIEIIQQFSETTGLSPLPNVLMGKIDDKTADEILGITSAPQLFIYNKKGMLTKQFKGSTKIEAIVKYANQL